MVVDASKENLLIGVCGAGAMGRGIVQVASVGGIRVKVFDINNEQLEEALKFIDNMLGRAVEKGRIASRKQNCNSIEVSYATLCPKEISRRNLLSLISTAAPKVHFSRHVGSKKSSIYRETWSGPKGPYSDTFGWLN